MMARLDASGPSEHSLDWFDRAVVAVEVLQGSPDNEQWRVWVSNDEPGHGWGGSVIAVCSNEDDARLVALALQRLRDERVKR